jgi:muramoyltetrapeptide carboxypeptidase
MFGSSFLFNKKYAPKRRKSIRPKRLKKGAHIGLITPGSFIDDEGLQKAVNNLENLGFKVSLAKNIRAERGFTAGSDQERLADLHHMFADKSIDGIWCARGGYGCSRLLPYIDYRLIKKNPKIVIGYSDITALLIAIYQKTGLIGFHGPVASSDFNDYTESQLRKVIIDPQVPNLISLSAENESLAKENAVYQSQTIRSGIAEGKLIGGNLSLLAPLAGTKFQPDIKGKLLFIEEIGEAPYRIDRMLTQLRQSYPLKAAAGIILGVFRGCERKEGSRSLSLQATLKDRLGDLNIPVVYGTSFGHISNMCTLPIGVKARLDADKKAITLLEKAVL